MPPSTILDAEAAHAGCKFWSAGAYRSFVRELEEARGHTESVEKIRESCCAAVANDDPVLLCAVLAAADGVTSVSTDIRFATAIAAMAAKKYACAYAAWDDGGSCWSRASDDPWVPDSAHAASVLMAVCDEAGSIREGVPVDMRRAGDTSDLCSLMNRMNTGAD